MVATLVDRVSDRARPHSPLDSGRGRRGTLTILAGARLSRRYGGNARWSPYCYCEPEAVPEKW